MNADELGLHLNRLDGVIGNLVHDARELRGAFAVRTELDRARVAEPKEGGAAFWPKTDIAAMFTELRSLLKLDGTRFDNIHHDPNDPFPASEAEVHAWIAERTRVWREAWPLPLTDRIEAAVSAKLSELQAELASREPKCTRVHNEEATSILRENERLARDLTACHDTIGQLSREALHVERLRETSTQQTEVIERLSRDIVSLRDLHRTEREFADRETAHVVVERDQLRRDLAAETQRYAALETQHNLAVEHLESLADNLKAAHEQARDWKLTT